MHPTKFRTDQQGARRSISRIPSLRASILIMAFAYCLFLIGCGTVPTRNPIPEELGNQAVIPGIPKGPGMGGRVASLGQ